MSVPDNGITRFDGRVGPLWEHFVYTATCPFWALKLLWVYGYSGFWASYASLIIILPLTYILHRKDYRGNWRGINDGVDQRVPLLTKIFGIIFIISLAIVIHHDVMYEAKLEQEKIEHMELENILESVPETGGEIV
jgi:hypothetical protein